MEFTKDSEDIHMNMEVLLTERIGATGKRLHTARSRNDQVAVDFRLYVKEEIPHIITMMVNLEKALVTPGRGQPGRPSCPAIPTCSGPSPSPSPTR